MNPIKVKDKIHWVGVRDPALVTFDIIMTTKYGTTYNAYLVEGEDKIAVIDTVKESFTGEFLGKIGQLVDPGRIDYIIINHSEPDHSGALPALLEAAPKAKVYSSASAYGFLKHMLTKDFPHEAVKDGQKLDLGGKSLQFISAPFLHWPDTIFTYLPQDQILFTCDVFGSHFCTPQLFDDEVGDFAETFQYYFDCIMRPFKDKVIEGLKKIEPLTYDTIAPSHGPVLRTQLRQYFQKYWDWSWTPPRTGKRLVIAYVSVYRNTRKMAEAIFRGAQQVAGVEAMLFDAESADPVEILAAIESADGLMIGSPTINADAVKPVWDVLSALAMIKVRGKKGTAFGSFGWSGEAVPLILERMKGLKFAVNEPGLKINFFPSEEDLKKCEKFGEVFAQGL